jgi:hypothetical protein
MNWKLFLDDERFPKEEGWVIARTSAEAIDMCQQRGLPQEITFDHDLGGADTSMVFLKWLTDALLDKQVSFPEGFDYGIHSQNPVGARNIKGLMDTLIREFAT